MDRRTVENVSLVVMGEAENGRGMQLGETSRIIYNVEITSPPLHHLTPFHSSIRDPTCFILLLLSAEQVVDGRLLKAAIDCRVVVGNLWC